MKPPVPFTYAHQIRTAREAAHLTQLELSQYLGVSRITVNRLESGQMVMQPHTALHLAVLFAWLAYEPGTAAKPKSSNYNPRSNYNFATLDQRLLKLEQVDALPVGTHYLFQQDLKGWRTRVRGTGSRWDDDTVHAGAGAELSDAAWVDATAKRLGAE